MAKCFGYVVDDDKHCSKEWKWDWEKDILRTPDGTACQFIVLEQISPLLEMLDATLYLCPNCMATLGVFVESEHRTDLLSPMQWKDVDWDNEEHSYEETPTAQLRS